MLRKPIRLGATVRPSWAIAQRSVFSNWSIRAHSRLNLRAFETKIAMAASCASLCAMASLSAAFSFGKGLPDPGKAADSHGADELIRDREIWACANTVLTQHGERAAVFVAERIGAMALAGDQTGIDVWKAVADRMDRLTRSEGPIQ